MYFDVDLVKDFSKPIKYKQVYNDIKRNNFKNIVEDENVYEDLASMLTADYNVELANYKAYMEKGMDLRVFMELRKSAMLNSTCREFFEEHQNCKTIEDIKQLRTAYLSPTFNFMFIGGYRDEDFQLCYAMFKSTPIEKAEYLEFDFDALGFLKDTPEGYRRKIYVQELLRIYTDYDPMGRPRKEPYDTTRWLEENGYI